MAAKQSSSIAGKTMNFFDISLKLADALYSWSSAALVAGAILVLAQTIDSLRTGDIRERYTYERTAKNEYSRSSVTQIAGAVLVLVGTIGSLWTGDIRERYTNERIAKNEASIAPRLLSEAQRFSLMPALRAALRAAPLAAQQPLQVDFTVIGDQEAAAYGEAIWTALKAAGVRGKMNQSGTVMPPVYGLSITLRDGNQRSLSIKAAFEKAQIPVDVSFGEIGAFDAKILVGLRPLGPQH
jgi:hypothetical protein